MLLPQMATWLHLTSTSPSIGSGLGALSSIAIFRGSTIWMALIINLIVLGYVRKLDQASSGFFFRLAASGCIDDKTNIACFAVFARRKNTRSRADDGVF